MKKFILIALILIWAGSAGAESGYLNGPKADKLKRGVGNAATGIFEIPKEIKEHWEMPDNSPIQKSVQLIGGTVKGLAEGVMRTLSGLFDVLTFNLELDESIDPVKKPEYIWDKPEL